jgi:TonB family protein
MIAMKTENERFKKAVKISITAHVLLFILILVSPYIPKPTRKRMIHYVNVVSFPGGGGGSGGESGGGTSPESVNLKTPPQEETVETVAPTRESLKDLTTPPKVEKQSSSTLRHPVDKPEREKKQPEDKKAVIAKKQKPKTKTGTQTKTASTSGSGSGSGIKLGIGSGSGGGVGSEHASEIGLSGFPFPYYVRHITARISGNWIKSYAGPEEIFTTVLFRIYRNGDIGDLKVVERSGIQSLDRSAVRAIYSSAPLAPLPQGYLYDYLEIQLIFEHSK